MLEGGTERAGAWSRSLLWMESSFNGDATTAWEEDRKEELLAVFRELAHQSERGGEVHEYVPWQPLW